MSLLTNIYTARDTALKNKDTAALSTLRVLCSALKNKEIDAGKELSDEDVQAVIKTQVKQLKDAMSEFEQAGRDDLAAQNKVEIDLLEQYLPAQMSDDALDAIVKDVVTAAGDGANFGQLMGMVMGKVNGQADGNRVKEMVQKHTS